MSTDYLQKDEQDESSIKKKSLGDLKAFLFLIGQSRAEKYSLGIGIAFLLLNSLCAVFSAKFMANFIDEGLSRSDLNASYFWGGVILGLEFILIFFSWTGRRILAKASGLVILNIRALIFEKLQKLPISYYDRNPQGRIITRITHDVEGIETFFTHSMGRLVNSILTTVIALTALFTISPEMGALIILSLIPAIVLVSLIKSKIRTVQRNISKSSSQVNSKLSEFISGVAVIRSFGLENWSMEEYQKSVTGHEDANLNANSFYSWSRPLISMLCALPLIVVIIYGGMKTLGALMTVGVFVSCIRYCEKFYFPILTIAREFHVVQQAFTNSERVALFLWEDDEDSYFGDGSNLTPELFTGKISFKDIWMAYKNEHWILKGISFEIRSGEKIGIVGDTGSGKSTVVSLLAMLYRYQKGEVTIDGVPIDEFDRNFLRKKIGFVSQDAIIFKGSMRENLDIDSRFSDGEIIDICEMTGLSKIFMKNSQTLDSHLYEGGENLSGGEKQLLCFTRVLLAQPSIIILDEATANIDPYYEEILHHSIFNRLKDITCLFIAHRLNTLKECDRIFVFKEGRLVEQGTQASLLAKKGHYYQLDLSDSKRHHF